MPPKKKDKKAGDDTLGHTINILEKKALMLEIEIANEQEKADRAKTNENELRNRLKELDAEFFKQEERLYLVANDMTSQYKRMQDEMLNQVKDLTESLEQKDEELKKLDQKMQYLQNDYTEKLSKKDQEIDDLKRKIEKMSQEFAKMLKDTLEKMQERIEMVQWDNDTDPNMMKKLKDMTNINN